MAGLFGQIGAVFSTPLGVVVLALALLAIAGTVVWAFWGDNDVTTRSTSKAIPSKTAPPPILAPKVFTSAGTNIVPQEHTVRNVVLGCVALAAIVFAGANLRGSDAAFGHDDFDGSDLVAIEADNARDGTLPADAYQVSDNGALVALGAAATAHMSPDVLSAMCAEGFASLEQPVSYTLCAADQAARFDRIKLSRSGRFVLNPAWNKGSGYTVKADNQAAPFVLDGRVAMMPASDMRLTDYDAFITLGVAENEVVAEKDPAQVAATRAFSTGRFVLATLRGDPNGACTSDAMVYAVSAGRYQGAGDHTPFSPVIIGVKFDERFPVGSRDMDALIDQFLTSQGAALSGMRLRDFAPRKMLFAETICRLPV